MCVRNVTMIFSVHSEMGICNSMELYKIIEDENPEVIFAEFDAMSRAYDVYYKNVPDLIYGDVEITAMMKYLEKHKIIIIPVDTHDPNAPQRDSSMFDNICSEISGASEYYVRLTQVFFELICQVGFPFLNSVECAYTDQLLRKEEKKIIAKLKDDKLYDAYKLWKRWMECRDNEMLRNIYNYSQDHEYNKAVFVIGAAHAKSILNKIKKYDSKSKIKINWESWRFPGKTEVNWKDYQFSLTELDCNRNCTPPVERQGSEKHQPECHVDNKHKGVFMKNYQCKKCGTVIQSNSQPSPLNCPAGGTHSWTNLGDTGDKNYQCKKCGTVIRGTSQPSPLNCPSGGTHSWSKL